MAQETRIGWTDTTYNPFQGCHKVSPGCKHCYMFGWQARVGKAQDTVVRSAPATFQAPLTWERQFAAGTWRGAHHTSTILVFTCSLSDFFIEEADPWREDVWAIIRATPHLTYQILTKRPENIAARLPADWGQGYANVWLGVSVENARWLARLETLYAVPAALHFASFEPLLGALGDLTPWLARLGWAIIGGESGPRFRPMQVRWLLDAVAQCQAAGVPTFVKQDSALKPGQQGVLPAPVWALKQLPDSLQHTAVAARPRGQRPRAAPGAPVPTQLALLGATP